MEHKSSVFARWMAEMGLTNVQAAERLGMSVARVKDLKAGGPGAVPDARTLLAMQAIKCGLAPYKPA